MQDNRTILNLPNSTANKGRKATVAPNPTSKGPNLSTRLYELAVKHLVELWRDEDDMGWATAKVRGHNLHMELSVGSTRPFADWLTRLYFEEHGNAPGDSSVKEAISLLRTQATGGQQYEMFTRVAKVNGNIYLDLVDAKRRVVEIRPDGWSIIDDCPIKFRRDVNMRPLPAPVPGPHGIQSLIDLLNLDDPDGAKLVIASIRPGRIRFCFYTGRPAQRKAPWRGASGSWWTRTRLRFGSRPRRSKTWLWRP